MSEPPEQASATSLTARGYEKLRREAARDGAPPGFLADVAELGPLTARLEAIAAETLADDSGDMDRVDARGRERDALNARLDAIMARGWTALQEDGGI